MDDCSSRRTSWASEPDLVDVFPYSDRIVDLASVDHGRASEGKSPIFVEISHPWPPNEANSLEPATWQLELLVVGDNITPERSFVTLSFDGQWPQLDDPDRTIWQHFLVHGPNPETSRPSEDALRNRSSPEPEVEATARAQNPDQR